MTVPNRPPFQTLTEMCEEAERTHPPVAEAKRDYDEFVQRTLLRARIDARREAEGKRPLWRTPRD